MGRRTSTPWFRVAGGIAAACALVVACGSKGSSSGGDAPDGGGPSSSGDVPPPPPGGFGDAAKPDVADIDAAECAASSAQAKKVTRPVDIVFVIDNSLTMKDKIAVVQNQISTNLVSIIDAAKIDYRVILVTAHGPPQTVTDAGDPVANVCIKAPLSGTDCNPVPATPAETTRFFHHSVRVLSNDAWCKFQLAFDTPDDFNLHPTGIMPLLRPNAFKVLIVATDDRVSATCKNRTYDDSSTGPGGVGAASFFDDTLTVQYPTQFGSKLARNYIEHAIVGVTDYDPMNISTAWPPSEPVTTNKCTAAFNPGTGYQGLADLTGGLRYPVCNLDYSAIFGSIAASTITGASLDCDFEIPSPPPGQTLDLSTVVPQFTPSNGAPSVYFKQVPTANDCAPNDFYIADGKVRLCPDTCNTVKADTGAAQIKILYGCDPQQLPGAH